MMLDVTIRYGHDGQAGCGFHTDQLRWEHCTGAPYQTLGAPTWFEHHGRGRNRSMLLGAFIAPAMDN